MASSEILNVYAAPMPFSNKQVKVEVPYGSTVYEIVGLILPGEVDVTDIGAIVYINDHVVLRCHWKRVRPKQGTIVNVRVVPKKGGGKNPLMTLLSVAFMIAAPYAGAALASAGLVGGFWAGSLFVPGALVGRAIVSAVGFLLTSALSSPPKQAAVKNPTERPTQFIEGAQNILDPWGVVPINLGTNRMVPKKAARGFVETSGGDQYARDLFMWGWGDKVVIGDLRIGENAIEEFDDLDVEHRINGDLHLGTGLYVDDVAQEDFSVVLKSVDGFSTRRTAADADEAVVDLTWSQGLCKFDGTGNRLTFNVKLEIQFAVVGASPQVWSSGAVEFTAYAGGMVTFGDVAVTTTKANISGTNYFVGYRKDIVLVDAFTGAISILNGFNVAKSAVLAKAPLLPSGTVRLATATVLTKTPSDAPGASVTSVIEFSDDRQPALSTPAGSNGVFFLASTDFSPAQVGLNVTVAAGSLKADPLNVTSAQSEALRRSVRLTFPARGQYDIRIRRITTDKEGLGLTSIQEGRIFDEVALTAIKTYTHRAPVNLQGINGTAMRVRGTDQLNGQVSTFNGVVSLVLPDYDLATNTWVDRISSNPASLYRYVLQCAANKKAVGDSRINLDDLADWHDYCVQRGYTYNRIIDFETTVDEVLRDIASAGAASPSVVDNLRTIVIDRPKDDIVQMITPRNSWGYNGDMVYPDLPHGFRISFRNKEKGYVQDERIVYADGYNEFNATLFETLDYESCDNQDLAFKHGRRHLANVQLRRETHSVMMDLENLIALRGNRVKLMHDAPLIGVGDGRIKSVQMTGGSPNLVAGFTLDDTITIPFDATFYVRARLFDGTFLYRELDTVPGPSTSFTFALPIAMPYSSDSPSEPLIEAGTLCGIVEVGGELDVIITRIDAQDDFKAKIVATNYAQPDIEDAESIALPAFVSSLTTPIEFMRPVSPVLAQDPQTGESAMLTNSDGSFLTRAIFTLINENDGDIVTSIKIRKTGTDTYTNANVLDATPERVIITGLDDDTYYDAQIRYKRAGSSVMSLPLQVNFLFVGGYGVPAQPTNFSVVIQDGLSLFTWDAANEINHDHWVMKYSGLFEGAAVETAQLFRDNIFENTLAAPFLGGTYFLTSINRNGNESATPAIIITFDSSGIQNVVAQLVEAPAFGGTFDNTQVVGSALVLVDTGLVDGYYYFANNPLNLDAVYLAFVSASISATGTFINNIFDEADLFALSDIYGSGSNDIYDELDIFAMDDVYGIDPGSWAVELQYRTTQTSPTASPAGWSAWAALTTGSLEFYAIEFRLKLTSLAVNVSPSVSSTLTVTVDMPDRIERGNNLNVLGTGSPADGATITFSPPFRAKPGLAITLKNAAHDDKIVFTSETASGFSFSVYNQTTAGYVTRVYDYIASGYGRESI